MFSTAKSISPKTTPTSKGKKKEEFAFPGLEELAVADALIKNLTAYKETIELPLKDTAMEDFLARARGSRPENLRGVDGGASASIELRKRSTRSVLTADEQEILTKKGIPFDTVTDVTGTFVINPEALEWLSKNADKVEKALATVKGLPKDFILKQDAVTRFVVSDETVDTAFKRNDVEAIKIATLVAFKPTLTVGLKLAQVVDLIGRLFGSKLDDLKDLLKKSIKKAA